ncbi:Universal stress protein family protein [Candidatus Nitrosocosmicus oleophilus]|uniref:Universal stress protein family protein n=1 Tax=Candidatus Nitrosocosmicus oleophilus TaxID=1353260 RepID=A0A654LZC7_9ARCH|nr:universal stress protein [Candidatus Nitrosocosmicus oleophilus]ALI36798.1 Universal stress protein family protein [Candidatus Nitrosocosmicus oleophilus]
MYKDLNISRILVGIDGSEYSIRALEFSKNLAHKYNSQIIAFTAFNIPDMYKIFEKREEDYNTISIEKEIRELKILLSNLTKKAIEEGINLKSVFYDTKLTPDLAMTEYAESEGVNHIVIGYRGRSFENLLIGNIATSIVKISKCSVTIIK